MTRYGRPVWRWAGATDAGDRDSAGRRLETASARSVRLAGRNDTVRRPRRQRAVAAIHRLGPRVLAELLDEIGRHHGIADALEARVIRCAGLDPEILRAVGADRFALPPVWVIEARDG